MSFDPCRTRNSLQYHLSTAHRDREPGPRGRPRTRPRTPSSNEAVVQSAGIPIGAATENKNNHDVEAGSRIIAAAHPTTMTLYNLSTRGPPFGLPPTWWLLMDRRHGEEEWSEQLVTGTHIGKHLYESWTAVFTRYSGRFFLGEARSWRSRWNEGDKKCRLRTWWRHCQRIRWGFRFFFGCETYLRQWSARLLLGEKEIISWIFYTLLVLTYPMIETENS